jgi:hypothetical protein
MGRVLGAVAVAILSSACAAGGKGTNGTPGEDSGTSSGPDAGSEAGGPRDAGGDAQVGGDGGSGDDTGASSGSDGGCNSVSCLHGCCTTAGQCVAGDMPSACGNGGNYCIDCTTMSPPLGCSMQACGAEMCTGCSGCCDTTGTCQPGVSDQACGTGGQACIDCSAQMLSCGNQMCGQ